MADHYLDDSVTQPFWDNSVTPRLEVESGDVIAMDIPESCNQVTPKWTDDDLAHISFDPIHALIGSIYVKGAEPGDTLQVDILKMEHKGWGWSGHLQGFGLLADDFPAAYIHHWKLEGDACHFGVQDIRLPFEPFFGTIGVAPKEPGRINTIPPRANAGNVDIRSLGPGATVWLPVFVPGALVAIGDCHSAQGDGEVCGTGVESPMRTAVRLSVRKDLAVRELQFETRGPLSKTDRAGYHATTAHGPDLMENAKNAVRHMIDWLVEHHDLTRSQAYVLCSTAGDLKISEIVDVPNWIVSFYMPRSIFSS
ncbi:MAG TPA: acetamidase/formamidase family protein [Anaerolineales bacterium]